MPEGIICQVKGEIFFYLLDILEYDQKVKFASAGAIVDLAV